MQSWWVPMAGKEVIFKTLLLATSLVSIIYLWSISLIFNIYRFRYKSNIPFNLWLDPLKCSPALPYLILLCSFVLHFESLCVPCDTDLLRHGCKHSICKSSPIDYSSQAIEKYLGWKSSKLSSSNIRESLSADNCIHKIYNMAFLWSD